jgi:hypothetical protein
MITEVMIDYNHKIDVNFIESLPKLTNYELKLCKHVKKVTSELLTIEKLFEVYEFNHFQLLQFYELNFFDTIERLSEFEFKTTDEIALNALTISLISSGKTLIEKIEVFIKGIDNEKMTDDDFSSAKSELISKQYDENFYYRFIYFLRNFSQHGNMPLKISTADGVASAYFDLHEIVNIQNYTFNGSMKQQFDIMYNYLIKNFSSDGIPKVQYAISIVENNNCLNNIMFSFYTYFEKYVLKIVSDLECLAKSKPHLISNSSTPYGEKYSGYILWYDRINFKIIGINSQSGFKDYYLEQKSRYEELCINSSHEIEFLRTLMSPFADDDLTNQIYTV